MKKHLLITLLLLLSTVISKAQWQSDVRLTVNPSTSYTSYNNARCIATSGDSIHVVWEDSRDGNQEIYYKLSVDGGVSWGADNRLTNSPFISWFPSICVSGPNVHVVWFDDRDGNYEIYYKGSSDAGVTWGIDIRLTNDPGGSGRPSIFAKDSIIHVAWGDDRNGGVREMYYKRSADGGITWGTDTRLTYGLADSRHASVSASGSDVHILWIDLRDGNYEVYYKRSADGGLNWGPDTRLTNNITLSEYPSLLSLDSAVHVIWTEGVLSSANIFYKHSTNGGISWQPDVQLTNNTVTKSIAPSVAVFDSIIHLVWQDNRDGNDEIYYKQSLDQGVSWSTDSRLTYNSASSQSPFAAVSNAAINVVWQDNRDGNFEIYYKLNPTGIPVGIDETLLHANRIQVFPNPASNHFTIALPSINKKVEVTVTDITKKIIYATSSTEVQKIEVNTNYLSEGVYVVRIQTADFIVTKKLIIAN